MFTEMEERIMAAIILRTSLEIFAAALLIFGFMHEREIIRIENYLIMSIKVKYRRYKRRKRIEQMRKNRELRLVAQTKRAVPVTESRYVA